MVVIFNIQFQWQNNSNGCLKYLIYVWLFAIYFNFVLMLSIYTASECEQLDFYLIYLTNWNVMLNALSSIFGAVLITLQWNNNNNNNIIFKVYNEPDEYRMSKMLKIHWFLSNLSTIVSISVSLAYWPSYDGRDAGLNDILTHAGNSIVLFIDTFVHARPPRYGHFIYPFTFGILYLIVFSLPYQLLGGVNRDYKNYIYRSLDWTNNTKVAIKSALMLTVLLVIVHIFITYSIVVRHFLYSKFKCNKDTCITSQRNIGHGHQSQSIV